MSRYQEIADACWRALRTLEGKRKVTATINRLVAEALYISPDDIFISLIPVSNENFSFGRGELKLAEDAPHW
ncbi:tautomerase family protein [Streptomyces sp. NPDC056192]|uniref:tautomerase family protein n=1 Tax=unclassified Streptomyces TaxID=2593676 RepID=UPI0035E14015